MLRISLAKWAEAELLGRSLAGACCCGLWLVGGVVASAVEEVDGSPPQATRKKATERINKVFGDILSRILERVMRTGLAQLLCFHGLPNGIELRYLPYKCNEIHF